MNAWYVLTFPALLILTITAIARLADLGRDQWKKRHHVRRLGLIGVGFLSGIHLVAPFMLGSWRVFPGPESSWLTFAWAWSWAFVWVTTPNMVPWYDFVLGVHRNAAGWKALSWRERIRAEARALANSFRPHRKRKPLPERGDTAVPPG